ncbi:hypothetical protein O181_112070 [Austropuccinia psidii MF-1]|uniref:Uncharacterized protein n=1 Tax=Austropuccinia psidii MF-1 TaxID=1389203 RepID=A0A9Q3JZQ7_9BASI|nr:hypothetical protein [Austropuccinia psidii MF-1]
MPLIVLGLIYHSSSYQAFSFSVYPCLCTIWTICGIVWHFFYHFVIRFIEGYHYTIHCILPDDPSSTTPPSNPPTAVDSVTELLQANLVQLAISSLLPGATSSSTSLLPVSLSIPFNSQPALASAVHSSSKNTSPPYYSDLAVSTNTSTSLVNQELFNKLFECFDTRFCQYVQDFHQYFWEAQTTAVHTPHLLCLQSSLSILMDLYHQMSNILDAVNDASSSNE